MSKQKKAPAGKPGAQKECERMHYKSSVISALKQTPIILLALVILLFAIVSPMAVAGSAIILAPWGVKGGASWMR